MALTQISTDGVKDDAVTAGKIPANAVGSSELADNAVDTAAIANDAVTNAKMADDAVGIAELSATGTASSSTFLRGDNSWTAVNTDLVSDTSPQLGGDLDTNGHEVKLDDDHHVIFGNDDDMKIKHSGSNGNINNYTGDLVIRTLGSGDDIYIDSNDDVSIRTHATDNAIKCLGDGGVELYYDASKKLETTSAGVLVSGSLTADGGNAITLGDSKKIVLGTGSDLEIYFDGSKGVIDSTTANLDIQSPGAINIKPADSAGITAFNGGAVELYHNANKKFATRSDGIEVQSSGSNHGIFIKHSNGNVVAKMQNKGSGDEGYLALYDSGGAGPSIQMDGEHGRITATSIRLHTNDAANELDDYEEGTFTLTLSKSDGSDEVSGGTVNYTKIGRWVNCWGQVTFGNAAASIGGSHCYMKGWPFAFGAANSNDVPVWVWNNGTQLQGINVTLASMSGSTSSTTWGLYVHTYNNAPSISGSDMGNGGRVSLGYSYQA